MCTYCIKNSLQYLNIFSNFSYLFLYIINPDLYDFSFVFSKQKNSLSKSFFSVNPNNNKKMQRVTLVNINMKMVRSRKAPKQKSFFEDKCCKFSIKNTKIVPNKYKTSFFFPLPLQNPSNSSLRSKLTDLFISPEHQALFRILFRNLPSSPSIYPFLYNPNPFETSSSQLPTTCFILKILIIFRKVVRVNFGQYSS